MPPSTFTTGNVRRNAMMLHCTSFCFFAALFVDSQPMCAVCTHDALTFFKVIAPKTMFAFGVLKRAFDRLGL